MDKKKFGIFSSSADPSKLSGTVNGVLIILATAVVVFAHQLGFDISQFIPVADGGTTIVVGSVAISGAQVVVVYGLLRKVVVAVSKQFTN